VQPEPLVGPDHPERPAREAEDVEAALVEYNDDLAAYLAARLREAPDFELAVEPELSVVCFRHLPEGWDRWPAGRLNAYQNDLQRALELDGAAWVSVTTLRGHTYLRAGVVNYLSSTAEIDGLIDALHRVSEGVLEDLDHRRSVET